MIMSMFFNFLYLRKLPKFPPTFSNLSRRKISWNESKVDYQNYEIGKSGYLILLNPNKLHRAKSDARLPERSYRLFLVVAGIKTSCDKHLQMELGGQDFPCVCVTILLDCEKEYLARIHIELSTRDGVNEAEIGGVKRGKE